MKAFFSSSFRLSLPSGPAKPCFWASSRRSASEDSAAGEHGFGDAGDRHGEGQCGLHGPGAGALHAGVVDDEVDERLAGLLVDLVQHFGGDFNEVGVEFGLVPLLEHVADLGRGHAQAAAHEVVAFGDELHVGVFDAVVHHLDEVAGTVESDVGDARFAFGLGRDGFEDRLEGLPGFLGTTRHRWTDPSRAPSSPPDTPQPTKCRPRALISFSRRMVSGK